MWSGYNWFNILRNCATLRADSGILNRKYQISLRWVLSGDVLRSPHTNIHARANAKIHVQRAKVMIHLIIKSRQSTVSFSMSTYHTQFPRDRLCLSVAYMKWWPREIFFSTGAIKKKKALQEREQNENPDQLPHSSTMGCLLPDKVSAHSSPLTPRQLLARGGARRLCSDDQTQGGTGPGKISRVS